jgi:hypothetical protein
MFEAVVPGSGLSGWSFLMATYSRQLEALRTTSSFVRMEDYFLQNFSKIETVEDLLNDRRLLAVVLGAFGLDADINSKALIGRVLQDGTKASDALANRLSDNRYKELSKALGFGPGEQRRVREPGTSLEILSLFQMQQFEQSVGRQDEDLRIALFAKRQISSIAASSTNNDVRWLNLMGNPPVKKFMETALGLPASFGQLDIDRQLVDLKEKAQSMFGTNDLSELAQAEKMEDAIQKFLVRTQLTSIDPQNMSLSLSLQILTSRSL